MSTRPAVVVGIVLAAALGCAGATVSAASGPIDLRRVEAVTGDMAAGKTKATACLGCHGPAGIAVVPTFPNLAGQKPDYLYWALVAFQRTARPDSPMTAQVAPLHDADLRDLAAFFASLPPSQGDAAAGTDERGAALFAHGDPSRGIPPCQACHGADAGGHPASADAARYRTYPMLRGQHAAYVAQRLKDYRDGKLDASSNDHIMHGVARTLDDPSIEAIARWLQAGAR